MWRISLIYCLLVVRVLLWRHIHYTAILQINKKYKQIFLISAIFLTEINKLSLKPCIM
jgi:hypothetical protein